MPLMQRSLAEKQGFNKQLQSKRSQLKKTQFNSLQNFQREPEEKPMKTFTPLHQWGIFCFVFEAQIKMCD